MHNREWPVRDTIRFMQLLWPVSSKRFKISMNFALRYGFHYLVPWLNISLATRQPPFVNKRYEKPLA